MIRRKIKLGGRLSGIAIVGNQSANTSPPVPNDVLALAKPPVVEPKEPAPVLPPPEAVEVVAIRKMLAELGSAVEKLRTRERATIDDVAQTTVELSIALAERLVGAEIAADRQRLDLIVRDALERMQPTRTLTVWGHADDLAVMERQLAEHGELAEYRSALTFRAVKSGVRGVLKIEADDWFVQWDTQRSLTELRDRLLEETFANE